MGQTIDKTACGRYNRLYKLTLEFEDAKKLKDKLGITFNHLCKVFTDKFVPSLMNEALKSLRKAAETDIGGTGGQENATSLKKVIQKTTKATKVARGTQETKIEDEAIGDEPSTMVANKTEIGSDDDEESQSEDEVMETDGVKKSKVTKYDNDES